MEEMQERLSPCPFCGGEVDLYGNLAGLIACSRCGASVRFDRARTISGVSEAWNRRVAPDPADVAELGRARARIAVLEEALRTIVRVDGFAGYIAKRGLESVGSDGQDAG